MTLLGRLCAAAGALVVLVAIELSGPGTPMLGLPSPMATPTPAAAAPPSRPAGTAAARAAIALARPLFAPGRRPPSVSSDAVAAGPVALPRLAGTVMVGAMQRAAIIVPPGAERPLVLHEGEQAGRFTVLRITSDSVDATGPAGPFTLHVAFTAAAAQTERPAPAAEARENPRNRGTTDQDE